MMKLTKIWSYPAKQITSTTKFVKV